MPSLNKVMLIGHLGKNPDVKYTLAGHAKASFSLATNRKWKDEDGEKKEDTTWHNITAWGKTAEVIAEYAKKGDAIYVEGRIENRSYEQDGVTKYFSEVVVSGFQFIGRAQQSRAPQTQPQPQGNGEDLPF